MNKSLFVGIDEEFYFFGYIFGQFCREGSGSVVGTGVLADVAAIDITSQVYVFGQ